MLKGLQAVVGLCLLHSITFKASAQTPRQAPFTGTPTTAITHRGASNPASQGEDSLKAKRAQPTPTPRLRKEVSTLLGVVLDRKTRAPVPYASVAVIAGSIGTITNEKGRFHLALAAEAKHLRVSSVGFVTDTVAVAPSDSLQVILLTPAAYELAGVQVQSRRLDPRQIMKQVVEAIPKNYDRQDNTYQVYAHRRHSNFDTVRLDIEYVSQVFIPSGLRRLHSDLLMKAPVMQHRVQEVQVLAESGKSANRRDVGNYGQGFDTGGTDPIRTSPLFRPGTWRRYRFQLDSILDRGGQTVYIISFDAKRANLHNTGTYLQAGYAGRIEVQKSDYAVTRYTALWEGDTATENRVARKHAGRGKLTAILYPNVYTAQRSEHTLTYRRNATGHYHMQHSLARGLTAGKTLKSGKAFYAQGFCEYFFTPLPANTPLVPLTPRVNLRLGQGEANQLPHIEHHPAFWQRYQRPSSFN